MLVPAKSNLRPHLKISRDSPFWFMNLLDRDVLYVMVARASGVAGSGICMLAAVYRLTPEVLGYYYGLLTIASWRLVMDGGMSYLLVRFVAHEWAHLSLRDGRVTGPQGPLERLAHLVRFSFRVYVSLACAFALLVIPIAMFIFKDGSLPRNIWLPGAIALSISTALGLLSLGARSLVEGTNQIALAQKGTLYSNIVGSAVGVGILFSSEPLLSVAVWFACAALVSSLIWLRPMMPFYRLAFSVQNVAIDIRREFLPLLWKSVINMIGALAMFQLLVPITFRVAGAAAAGRVGLMMQLYQASDLFGFSWVQAKNPRMAMHAAKKEFTTLERLTKQIALRATITAGICGAAIFAVLVITIDFFPQYASRLPSLPLAALFLVTAALFQFAHAYAALGRSTKREPFVALSLLVGMVVCVGSYALGSMLGANGVALAYFACITGFMVPATVTIAKRQIRLTAT